jgi:hypothetical protein
MVLQSLCGTVQIGCCRPDPGCLLGQPMPKARRRCRPPRSGTGSQRLIRQAPHVVPDLLNSHGQPTHLV